LYKTDKYFKLYYVLDQNFVEIILGRQSTYNIIIHTYLISKKSRSSIEILLTETIYIIIFYNSPIKDEFVCIFHLIRRLPHLQLNGIRLLHTGLKMNTLQETAIKSYAHYHNSLSNHRHSNKKISRNPSNPHPKWLKRKWCLDLLPVIPSLNPIIIPQECHQ